MKSLDFRNQLEFTIHAFDECDISRSPSPEELPKVEDEYCETSLWDEAVKKVETSHLIPARVEKVEQIKEKEGERGKCEKLRLEQIETEQLVKLGNDVEKQQSSQTPTLLQELTALKEEAWAKRKAKILKRQMQRVHFQDVASPKGFCRSCCMGKRDSTFGIKSPDNGSSDSSECSFKTSNRMVTKRWDRPVAQIHSINISQNIIPKKLLENQLITDFIRGWNKNK